MSSMAAVSPAAAALMTVAMMIAMMLPSVSPALWGYHRDLRAASEPRAGARAALVLAGYAGVWGVLALALSALNAAVFPAGATSPADPSSAPWAGVVVLCGGALQRSRWKARQLLRCRAACEPALAPADSLAAAWRAGGRLGIACAGSCAAPMAVLLATGFTNARVMVVITAAITAERVGSAGPRTARLTGAVALAAGLALCARAVEVAISGAA